MTVPSDLRLAGDFEPATMDQWRRLALGVLRKSGVADQDTPPEAVDDLLAVTSYDGIRIAPLYTAATAGAEGAAGLAVAVAGAGSQTWDIRTRYQESDPVPARQAILDDLENGATSIWLDLGEDSLRPSDLPHVLDGVFLDLIGVVLHPEPAWAEAAAETLIQLGPFGAGNLGFDPIGWAARTGLPVDLEPALTWARRIQTQQPSLSALTVDATVYHDAGASDAQELGASLATGVAYLRGLTGHGLDLPAAFGQLEFRYAASADQFLTAAKFRAARRLWARIAQGCGVLEHGAQRQHAVTSAAMMTARDPWVNMLRTTVACFGAAIGGAHAITVAPFDAALGRPDPFTRRIARNTASLLLDEAQVGQVRDPAGGSWYVERLTTDLARAAWNWFQEIERAGGMAAALTGGLVEERLAATWARRRDNIAHRRDSIIGVSEFPNLDERRPLRPPIPSRSRGGGLPVHRYSEEFEALRDRSDAHESATGARPRVRLATLGPASGHSGRLSFAANLFAAGGIESSPAPADTGDFAGAELVCLCGSDKAYAESAATAAAGLTAAGVGHVWLAGKPADHAGIESYVYTGGDAVAALTAALRDLGVA